MSEYRDLSPLPDDPAYWDALEQRVLAHARAADSAESPGWWAPLTQRAWQLGVLAAAATVAALLLTPGRPNSPVDTSTGLLRLPADADILATAEPPPLTALLLDRTLEESR